MRKLFLVLSLMVSITLLTGTEAKAIISDPCQGSTGNDNCIFSSDIINGEVQNDDIGADAVDSSKIADGSVTGSDIATGTVTGTNILDGTVDSADITAGAVTDTKITGPISASKITQGAGSGLDADSVDGMSAQDIIDAASGGGSAGYANHYIVDSSGTDYSTIDAAHAQCVTDGGSCYIEVMPGSYTLSGQLSLTSNVALVGSSSDTVTVNCSTAGICISIVSKSNILIKNLTIVNGGTRKGIYIDQSSYITVENNVFSSVYYSIWAQTASNNIKIKGNRFINFDIGLYFYWSINDVTIEDNFFTTTSGTGIYSAGYYTSQNNRFMIKNNTMKDFTLGSAMYIWQETYYVTIDGNLIDNAGGISILSQYDKGQYTYRIINNTIKNVGSTNGISTSTNYTPTSIRSIIIKNNTISGVTGASRYGILVPTHAIIDGNVVTGNSNDISIGATNVVLNHNTFNKCAGTIVGLYNAKSTGVAKTTCP